MPVATPRAKGAMTAIAAISMMVGLAGCSGGPAGELDYEDSPLSKYMSAAFGGDLSQEEQEKKFYEQQRQQEELMAECMAKEGFEYTPNDHGASISFGDDGMWEPDKKDWVEKYGYGMVNNPYNEQQPEEQPQEEYTDPNQEYVESLSEAEQQAYYETAYGKQPSEEELNEDGSYEWKWENAGCQGWAQHEVEGENPWQDEQFAGLMEKMQKFWEGQQDAPELRELNDAWASCMADAGEPGFSQQYEAQNSISEEQQTLDEAAWGDGAEPVDEESFVDPNTTPEMKALGEREIELALKDLTCRDKTDYRQKSLKIQFAAEEKFIAENKAELDAFKAAAEQQKN
ncbi:MAG: hypothetical protein WA971_16130 [Microbacterium sp.]